MLCWSSGVWGGHWRHTAGLVLLVTAGLADLNYTYMQALMPFDTERLTGLNLCYYLTSI